MLLPREALQGGLFKFLLRVGHISIFRVTTTKIPDFQKESRFSPQVVWFIQSRAQQGILINQSTLNQCREFFRSGVLRCKPRANLVSESSKISTLGLLYYPFSASLLPKIHYDMVGNKKILDGGKNFKNRCITCNTHS